MKSEFYFAFNETSYLNDASYKTWDVGNCTRITSANPSAIQQCSRHEYKNHAPKWLYNVEQCALCRREAKSDNYERQLL